MRPAIVTIIGTGNVLLILLTLLVGIMYPLTAQWSYFAVGVVLFHMILEILVLKARLLDAAKISAWSLQILSTLASIILLLPYKLGIGNIWAIVVAVLVGIVFIITVVIMLLFKKNGVADLKVNLDLGTKCNAG